MITCTETCILYFNDLCVLCAFVGIIVHYTGCYNKRKENYCLKMSHRCLLTGSSTAAFGKKPVQLVMSSVLSDTITDHSCNKTNQ